MPPGGPLDVAAPQVVSITPDSGTLGVRPKDVVFRFDEVVSERPPSVTTLADLFLISPRNGAPDVSWHREAIGVRPGRGWRPNTPYTVIMLPGIADIRGNVRNTGATTFFAAGPAIPRTRLAGHVFDWVSATPAKGALVESFVWPDSLHPCLGLVDSSGAFAIERWPPARYTVRPYGDANKNFGLDPAEAWDSVSVNLADSASTILLIFAHDSVPPRIRDVSPIDSVTLRVSFDKPVDPSQTLSAANFAVIGPDSSRVPIVSAGAPPRDTLPAPPKPAVVPPPAVRPPAPARRDTGPITKVVMPRPTPITEAVIKVQRPLAAETADRVHS